MRIAQHLISGGTQTKAPPSIAAPIASNAIDFFRVMKKSQLLPLNAADRAWSNPIGIEKGGEQQSQILSFKRRTTCPLKRGRSTLQVRGGSPKILTAQTHPEIGIGVHKSNDPALIDDEHRGDGQRVQLRA